MRLAQLLAAVAAAAAGLVVSEGFVVVGYVPDYRMDFMDWDQAVTHTTHLVLFSLEPRADAGLEGTGRIRDLLQPRSPLGTALGKAENPAKVLVTLGGAGRSQHFAKIAGNKKARKKIANAIADLLEELPGLAGLDLDWEAPTSASQWRDYGKLAQELRSSWEERPKLAERDSGALLLTMTFHPGTGAVPAFGSLRAKKSDQAFVDLFDFCHAMAYSHFDNERRHSTDAMDKAAVDEWKKYSLPLNRLTLGMPFFGVARASGEALSYADALARDPTLERRPQVDESSDGLYIINKDSMSQKVQFAGRQGLAGVMVWELGQDKKSSMLRHVSRTAKEIRTSWRYMLSWLPFGENHVIMVFSALAGAYLLREVLIGTPPGHKQAAQRPPPRLEASRSSGPTDGDAAPAPAAAPAEEAAPEPSEGERG